MSNTLAISALLLATAVLQVSAIGRCNNTLLTEIINTNDFCPTQMLDNMWNSGGAVTFRVLTAKYAAAFSCITGVMDKPENNHVILRNKFSFKDKSKGSFFINYTMTDSTCGINYKHIVERDHVLYKIAFGYYDGISFGYYGCTNEDIPTLDENETYAQCYTEMSDTKRPEVEESLLRCKERMTAITHGKAEMVLIEPCTNDNDYYPALLANREKNPFQRFMDMIKNHRQ